MFWFDLGCQKVTTSDFQSFFSIFFMSKIIWIFLIFFSLKNISLEEGFLLLSFFENFNFWTTLFSKMEPNFYGPCEHLWKSNQNNIFLLLIFLLKSTPCWLTSAKLYHWGHTKGLEGLLFWPIYHFFAEKWVENEAMCKLHYGNQDFFPLANGVYFIELIKKKKPFRWWKKAPLPNGGELRPFSNE